MPNRFAGQPIKNKTWRASSTAFCYNSRRYSTPKFHFNSKRCGLNVSGLPQQED
jgi:hypothetical protein